MNNSLKIQLGRTKCELKDQKRAFNTHAKYRHKVGGANPCTINAKICLQNLSSCQQNGDSFKISMLSAPTRSRALKFSQLSRVLHSKPEFKNCSLLQQNKLKKSSIAHRFVASNRYKKANTWVWVCACVRVCVFVCGAPFAGVWAENSHKNTPAHTHTIETREKERKTNTVQNRTIKCMFYNNNQQSKSNTLDGFKMIKTNLQKH